MQIPQASWEGVAQVMVDNQAAATQETLGIEFARAVHGGKMSLEDAALNLFDPELDDDEMAEEADLVMAQIISQLDNRNWELAG